MLWSELAEDSIENTSQVADAMPMRKGIIKDEAVKTLMSKQMHNSTKKNT